MGQLEAFYTSPIKLRFSQHLGKFFSSTFDADIFASCIAALADWIRSGWEQV